jgi:hypothetical protein
MARDVDGLDSVLSDGFSRYLLVDILHGTDIVASAVPVEEWTSIGDLDRDPKTAKKLRIVHPSVNGESWVPRGARGVLSPYRATLLITEVISVGAFERRVQLGLFDVVSVPYASDVTATIGGRWVDHYETIGDEFPESPDAFPPTDEIPPGFPGGDIFPIEDIFPGESVYAGGELIGGTEVVVASIVDVEAVSLDARVLDASFRTPRTSLTSAWGEWRAVGILPVAVSRPDVEIAQAPWPAEDGTRLDDVQACATALGGVPVVDSAGQWVLADDATPTVILTLGEEGTVVELSAAVSRDDFANVVIGNYEDDNGGAIRAEWTASGLLSPESMKREIVAFHKSPNVKTQSQADAAVAAEGRRLTSPEVDVSVTCVYNPMLELGDHVTVPGEVERGIARRISASNAATMTVVARVRRSLQ